MVENNDVLFFGEGKDRNNFGYVPRNVGNMLEYIENRIRSGVYTSLFTSIVSCSSTKVEIIDIDTRSANYYCE